MSAGFLSQLLEYFQFDRRIFAIDKLLFNQFREIDELYTVRADFRMEENRSWMIGSMHMLIRFGPSDPGIHVRFCVL